jgi:carbonic anhydrase
MRRVTAAVHAIQDGTTMFEKNIPPLIAPIMWALECITYSHKKNLDDKIIPLGIEENVWQSIQDLMAQSPVTRKLTHGGQVKVAGAIYDVETGKVNWLDQSRVNEIIKWVYISAYTRKQDI